MKEKTLRQRAHKNGKRADLAGAKLIETLRALGRAETVLANPIVDAWLADNLLFERTPGGGQAAVLRQGYAAPKMAEQRIERLTALIERRMGGLLTSKARRRNMAEVLAEDAIEVLCRAEPVTAEELRGPAEVVACGEPGISDAADAAFQAPAL